VDELKGNLGKVREEKVQLTCENLTLKMNQEEMRRQIETLQDMLKAIPKLEEERKLQSRENLHLRSSLRLREENIKKRVFERMESILQQVQFFFRVYSSFFIFILL